MILLIEDDPVLRDGLELALELENYETRSFSGPAGVSDWLRENHHQVRLAIVDIMLPGDQDGVDIVREIRARRWFFPVLFVTALDDKESRLKGLAAGGDDYITKPFDRDELLARVAAFLRRENWRGVDAGGEAWLGNWRLEAENGQFENRKTGKSGFLRPRELEMMRLFLENRGKVLGRAEILSRLYFGDLEVTNRTVDNLVLRLRKTFEEDPSRPRFFTTVHGRGYRLENHDE